MLLTALLLAVFAAGPADPASRFAPVEIKAFRSGQAFVLFEGRVVPEAGVRVPLEFLQTQEWESLRVWGMDGSPLKMLTLQPRKKGQRSARERQALDEAVTGDPNWVPSPIIEADHSAVLAEPTQRVHLRASILSSRFTWTPQYRLSLEGDGVLRADLEASVFNNLEDLDSVPVHFVASDICGTDLSWADPSAYAGVALELPPEDAMLPPAPRSGCGCSFAQPAYFPGMPGYYSPNGQPQAFLLQDGPLAPIPAPAQDEGQAPDAAGDQADELELPPAPQGPAVAFGAVPPVELTLHKGERAKVQVFSRNLEGQMAQLWDAVETDGAPAWQGLLVKNSSDLLLPQGPGSAFTTDSYHGEVCVPAIPVGAEAFIPLGPSPSLRGAASETLKASRTMESGNTLLDEQQLQGRVTLSNVSPREITVVVRRVVAAKEVSSKDFAVRNLGLPNESYFHLQARVVVPARSSKVLKYNLQRVLQTVR